VRLPLDYEKCIICLERPPDTWEHIIPQSVGGILEVRFLCKDCNSQLGSDVVSGLRSDARIRFALENLKTKLPKLHASVQAGLPYLAHTEDGIRLQVSKKGKKWRVHTKLAPDGSKILDLSSVKGSLTKYLRRKGAPGEQLALWQDRVDALEEGERLLLPTGQLLTKKSHSGPQVPDASLGFVNDRLPVLVAYEFLALFLHTEIYRHCFDEIRQYIRTGQPTCRIFVERGQSGKYAPGHMVDMRVRDTSFTVYVRFFRWLVFGVQFTGYAYNGAQAILFEDLDAGVTKVGLAGEKAGEWVEYPL